MSSCRLIPVVCVVLEDGAGRVLIAQRPAHKHLGLQWEFPGGKVEPGESAAAALTREIREELGCEIVVGECLPAHQHADAKVAIEMTPFVCRLAPSSPAPVAHEHVAVRWVTLAELRGVDLAAADWDVVREYESWRRRQ